MDTQNVLFERSRSNQEHEHQSLRRMEEDESSTDEDGYIISNTFNNNNETVKLIDVNEKKCDHHLPDHHHHHRNRRRRRGFRSFKTKKNIKNFLILTSISIFIIICTHLLIQIIYRDTYRTGMRTKFLSWIFFSVLLILKNQTSLELIVMSYAHAITGPFFFSHVALNFRSVKCYEGHIPRGSGPEHTIKCSNAQITR